MKYCISLIVLLMLGGCNPDTYTAPYFNGANSEGKMPGNPYLTPGDKAYVLGTQNGLFPDMGGHVKGEMGGIWAHPIKLADGFWLRVAYGNDDGVWLADVKDYVTFPHGNKFIYQPVSGGVEVERFQFVPDGVRGVIVEYTLTNRSDATLELDIDFLLKTDLSPVWLASRMNITDQDDTVEWKEDEGVFAARDSDNNWFVVWGSSEKAASWATNPAEPYPTIGKGKAGMIKNTLKLAPEKAITLTYTIAGSTKSDTEALSTYRSLAGNKKKLLDGKKRSIEEILTRSKITIPDKKLETACNWVKMNTRWLEMDLEGYGRFLGAGAVEYPWLFGCDNSYALQGVLAAGDFELALSTLTMLRNVSDQVNKGNGQIIHEMSTNGAVYNRGNTQETAHFIVCVWEAFKWTGDLEFLRDIYPYVKKGLNWLLTDQDVNKNMFPEGYGIMEVSGLNAELIDVAVYTQQALEAVSQMAVLFGENDRAGDCRSKAAILKDKINTLFWNEEEGIYCDFFGTRDQALQVTRGAVEQLGRPLLIPDEYRKAGEFYNMLLDRWSKLPQDTERGWFTNKNWVINTPMETGIAPEAKAIRTLDVIRNEHCGEWGPYLSAVEGRRMMTIATGVQAMSEARYGRIDECLWYMDRIASTLGLTLPGSITEMMPNSGCPVQAWTIYGMITPLVRYVFGINPDAYNKQVVICPQLPTGWNSMSLDNQRVGNNTYNISVDRSDGWVNIVIHSAQKDWQTILKIEHLKEIQVNGKQMIVTGDVITLQGSTNTISYRYM